MTTTQDRIVAALQLSPMTAPRLALALSLSQQSVNQHLTDLRQHGLADYDMVPEGRRPARRVWRSALVARRTSHKFRSALDGEECLCPGCQAAGLGEDAWLPCTPQFWQKMGGHLVYGACIVCRREALARRKKRAEARS